MESCNSFNPECYNVDWNSYNTELKNSYITVLLKEYGVSPSQIFTESHPQKVFRITVVSENSQENKNKLQKLLLLAQQITHVHSKEFKAQEKQYKQLLFQETHEKNQEILELKSKLNELKGLYSTLGQKKLQNKDSEKNLLLMANRKTDIHIGSSKVK